ncbi:4'-phosphopantetheinyl transferase superfamily protein [Cupriavidus basilensis]|uniref:4'-phosphopantetheinyl transferase superfamily protein n=1 Tax=Cupriavidus basilensis TaxID=68895 RepID=A0ABT6ASK0_9BURK|nr:4'-phosphopantetheinyl transferase superfamily protein [Cupriavidus basilensis]MDF3835363.1 4'-phosphopantetheinyl transferase superfamily protein [Cupriavidus basilensis]
MKDLPETDHPQVWRVHVPDALPWLDALHGLLSAEEQARVARLRSAAGRHQSILARGILRKLLGERLEIDGRDVVFRFGPHGKPELARPEHANTLRFNVSHSGAWVLIAIARGQDVGLDVEYMNERTTIALLAERIMTAAERRRFLALDDAGRKRMFFGLWACKEAYVKAIGAGLSLPPDQIEFDAGTEGPPTLLRAYGETAPGRWALAILDMPPDYAAALMVDGPTCIPAYRDTCL